MAIRYRTCQCCAKQFEYTVSRGTDRKYCSTECANASAKHRAMSKDAGICNCSVDGCSSPATRVGAGMCEKHYYRMRRNGKIETLNTVKQGNLIHTGGYLLSYAPDHPLRRGSSPRVYEHRIVYYAEHGDGPFNCNWCGCSVTWDDMHVDHLNAVVTDNSPNNLVASCALCNQFRGKEKMKATARSKAAQYTAHGKTMCLSQWASYLGISRVSIKWRLDSGWSVDEAFTPRQGKSGPPSKTAVV